MDWRRAKSVLIFSFLMLNLLLGYQLWLEYRERLNTVVDWTSLPPETQQVMHDKNIQMDDNAKIPTETPVLSELTYTFKERATNSLNERVVIESMPETQIVFYEDELDEALSHVIPGLNLFTLDQMGNRDGVFVFNRMVGMWPLFDIHLELFHSEQKIKAYAQDVIEIKPADDDKEQQVLPAAQALAKVIERNLPAGSIIKEIRLGFHGEIFDDAETQVSSPTWRVLLENGEEVYYVNAISAEVTIEKGDASITP